MRIHSSFHDYYDSILSFGQDPKINYVRKTEDFWVKSFLDDSISAQSIVKNRKEEVNLCLEIIGFCGEIVPIVTNGYKYSGYKTFYNVESVQKFLGEGKIPYQAKEWLTDVRRTGSWTPYDFNAKANVDIFKEYKVPVFHAASDGDGVRITLNPCLKTLEFYRKYAPFEAWQKLSHYVGNVLIEESKPVWPIPDKIKAESHGFNKYSFRKDKLEK
jgi:hypothetical protein